MNNSKRLIALATVAVLAIAGCGGSSTPENDHVLRIAMGSPGEAQIRVWDDVATQYMAAHPETKVEINYQQDDLYETIGLQSLLNGKNPPDIYFEWTGARLEQRVKDGFAADITDAVQDRRRWRASGTTPSWGRTRWTARPAWSPTPPT